MVTMDKYLEKALDEKVDEVIVNDWSKDDFTLKIIAKDITKQMTSFVAPKKMAKLEKKLLPALRKMMVGVMKGNWE